MRGSPSSWVRLSTSLIPQVRVSLVMERPENIPGFVEPNTYRLPKTEFPAPQEPDVYRIANPGISRLRRSRMFLDATDPNKHLAPAESILVGSRYYKHLAPAEPVRFSSRPVSLNKLFFVRLTEDHQ